MDKIFTFIINKNKELLLLKGSQNDPQYHKSFWYVVTGEKEQQDKTKEEAVIREVKEETNLNVIKLQYLNWVFKYNSLEKDCTEYVYSSFVDDEKIFLNEENIEYKWCKLQEFLDMIEWNGDKQELKKVIEYAIDGKVYYKEEVIVNC